MRYRDVFASIVIPAFNEEKMIGYALQALYQQQCETDLQPFPKENYEVIIVDNNSSDQTCEIVFNFKQKYPDMNIILTKETKQGVAWARKKGMDLAVERSRQLGFQKYYIFSTDADCCVDWYWIDTQLTCLELSHAALSVCQYYYPQEYFQFRPNLHQVIKLILKARDYTMQIFGGFPDGKGFAVSREVYEKVGGIEIFYQLEQGKFVCHLSDDWDFGIKVRASGEEIVYCPRSKVWTNPRRIDGALEDMIQGMAYGKHGIITMKNIRKEQTTAMLQANSLKDITKQQMQLLYDYSIKDFTTKHIILPLLLTPSLLTKDEIINFLSISLSEKLKNRIEEIRQKMCVTAFIPMHLYKTPCYRLYFEFREEIFERMRQKIDAAIGYPPPLPKCLEEILQDSPAYFNDFVYYYCEDRESGEAHDYFSNGGVF